MSTIREKIWKSIIELKPEAGLPETLVGNKDLLSDLGFNSIQLLELVVKLETELGVEFQDSDLSLRHFTDFASLVELIERRLHERQIS